MKYLISIFLASFIFFSCQKQTAQPVDPQEKQYCDITINGKTQTVIIDSAYEAKGYYFCAYLSNSDSLFCHNSGQDAAGYIELYHNGLHLTSSALDASIYLSINKNNLMHIRANNSIIKCYYLTDTISISAQIPYSKRN